MPKLIRRLLKPVAHGVWLLTPYWDRFRFTLRNHLSHQPVTSSLGPVVSVATYGPRLSTAHLAMESIAAGSLRPSRLLLWLDNPAEFANLTPALQRLQARGLEVKLSDRNYGPHKKYFPYVKSRRSENLAGAAGPLVTADDDIMYPRHWLEGLANAYRDAPDLVQCYRARVVRVTDEGLASYATWELCRSTVPSALTLAIGVSGVIYPPKFLDGLEKAGAAFEQICPRADDLWLHVNALRQGFLVCQIGSKPVHFTVLPGTQEMGLQQQNLHNNGNDEQVRKTYAKADVESLQAAANASPPSGSHAAPDPVIWSGDLLAAGAPSWPLRRTSPAAQEPAAISAGGAGALLLAERSIHQIRKYITTIRRPSLARLAQAAPRQE